MIPYKGSSSTVIYDSFSCLVQQTIYVEKKAKYKQNSFGKMKVYFSLIFTRYYFQIALMYQVSYNLRNYNVYFILTYSLNAFRQITGKAN